jgi:hypothetical protein
MKAYKITADQVLNSTEREYNPSVWAENVKRYTQYEDACFYVAKGSENGYSYDRYFVEYTIPEGIRFFKSFDYSASLTSYPFARVDIFPINAEGKHFGDIVTEANGDQDKIAEGFKTIKDDYFIISRSGFWTPEGKEVFIPNTKQGREVLIEKSAHGVVFTNEGL